MFMASLIDEVRNLQYLYISANSDQKTQPPEPIPRPGVESKSKRRKLTPEQYEWLAARINGSG